MNDERSRPQAERHNERERFEKWARDRELELSRNTALPNDYWHIDTQFAWECWQAAQQAPLPAEAQDFSGIEALLRPPMVHTMSCACLTPGTPECECTCGLRWRIHLSTEITLHNAWVKRANEAEAEVRALGAENARLTADAASVRELMNVYNLGGWTDAVEPMKHALAAESSLATSKARIERLRTLLHCEYIRWRHADDPPVRSVYWCAGCDSETWEQGEPEKHSADCALSTPSLPKSP